MRGNSTGVLIFSENTELALELLTVASPLADKLGKNLASVVIGNDTELAAKKHLSYGAHRIFTVSNPSLDYPYTEPYVDIILQIAQEEKPDLILVGATRNGSNLAASLGQKLGVVSATECLDLKLEDSNMIVERMYYGGRFVIRQQFKNKPWLATIPPSRFEAQPSKNASNGEILQLSVSPRSPKTKLLEVREREKGTVQIESADIIVSVGRGVREKEDIKIIQELAETIGGVIAGSRPVTEDLKWLPGDAQVGLSGKKVKPTLYVACGISGQIQHIVGMRDAKVVVAINTDPEAPIGEESDFFVVHDLYKFVPALTKAFKEALGS